MFSLKQINKREGWLQSSKGGPNEVIEKSGLIDL